MDNVYFANLPDDEIAERLYAKVEDYYDILEANGRMKLWRKSHRAYYGMDESGQHKASKIGRSGEQNELFKLTVNHYRNLLQHLHVIVTQQKPVYDCRAINTDYKSQTQTILGVNILEYYMREKRLAEQYKRLCEYCIVYAEGFLYVDYDDAAGDVAAVDPETGAPIPTGDVVVRVFEPINVIRRVQSDSDTKSDWYILRQWENRYDIAAQNSDSADKILNYSGDMYNKSLTTYFDSAGKEDDDLIVTYTFIHGRTAACPNGRKVKFIGADCMLSSEPLRDEVMPVIRMAAYNQDGTSLGYTVGFDLLGLQEASDIIYSTILTNQATFGVQNVWIKTGSNVSVTQVRDGLNFIQSNDKPEPINLTYTPPEIFNFLKGLENAQQVTSGINSVARGQPEASLKSGAALALVASQAVQFANGLQSAYAQALEDAGTALLKTLQQRATIPRITVIAGKNRRSYVKDFKGSDIAQINRVIVDLGNPVSQTIAGRIEMATNLLQQGMIKKPEQYIQVVTTGRIESITSAEETESLLIQRENESLRDGIPVPVIAVDKHVDHIEGHKEVLADPAVRADPTIVAATLKHINEHINALKTVDPNLLNLLGMNPITQPQPQVAGAMAPQPNAQSEGNPNRVEAAPGSAPEVAANMPSLPQNTPNELNPNVA